MKPAWQMTRAEFEASQQAPHGERNVLYRGISPESGAKSYRQGKGLYVTADPKIAAGYGKVFRYPMSAKPKNPLKLRSEDDWDGWIIDQYVNKLGMRNVREFSEKYPDPGEYVRSLGYDGVQIGSGRGATYINYYFPHHETEVRKALESGEAVPDRVLNDYPHLRERFSR